MKDSNGLRIAEIGDIHLGHHNTPTEHTIQSLNAAFPDNSITGALDLLFIAGDVFDGQLSFDDPDVFLIRQWINRLIRIASRRKIVVRVLKGTSSHDWTQSKEFINQLLLHEVEVDLKYIDEVTVEYVESLGIHVLYVPDEWRPYTEDTWKDVISALHRAGVDKVDYACMHGMFPHQTVGYTSEKLQVHDPEKYLGIVRKYIFIGHIHRSSQWDRILAAGSLERLGHGEEEPKGHLRVFVREDGNDDIEFVENKLAMTYLTIDCHGMEGDDLLNYIEESIDDLRPGSFVRIMAGKLDAATSSLNLIKSLYPQIHWTIKTTSTTDAKSKDLVDLRKDINTISLNKETIRELLLGRIAEKHPAKLETAQRLLEDVLNARS